MKYNGGIVKAVTSMALSVSALQSAIEIYSENFIDSPYLLIIGDSNYFLAKEILHYENGGADRIRLEVVGWMPHDMWMLTGESRHGLFISEGS